jgi:hypothetical protein
MVDIFADPFISKNKEALPNHCLAVIEGRLQKNCLPTMTNKLLGGINAVRH